jgi:hypothetical protein
MGFALGDNGNDTFLIDPGPGELNLNGGSGSDTFKFISFSNVRNTNDIISDFDLITPVSLGGDILNLPGNKNFYSMRQSSISAGSSELIDSQGDTLVFLTNILFSSDLMTTMINNRHIQFSTPI